MKRILLSETYMVLLMNVAGKHTDLRLPQYSAGMILGGIYDLLESGCVRRQENGRLMIAGPLPEVCLGLREIYKKAEKSSKDTGQWLDDYCCSATLGKISAVMEAMYGSLEKKGIAHVEKEKGIFRQKKTVCLRPETAAWVSAYFLEDTKKDPLEENTVFCILMLQLAGMLKKYFPLGERERLRSLLGRCRGTQIWNQMVPYVNRIRNFNFQNRVYSGAMYQ